jgi:hypothetical protein
MSNLAPNVKVESDEVLTQRLLAAVSEAGDGHCKNASEAGTAMIRRRLRENGFTRLILPFQQISDSDLTYLPDSELPAIVEEMEPDSPGAKSIPFNDTPDTQFYRGDKFAVYFCKITTAEYTKNVDELRTYKNDLRQVVTDNALKDIQTEEDSRTITEVNRVVGSTPDVVSPTTGVIQHYAISGGITRSNYKEVLNHLEDRELNNGVFLMNRHTAKEFLEWDRLEIGGDLAERLMKEGVSALDEAKIFGVRHIFTMKRDLVPDNVVFEFAEPSFLGRAYVLEDVTMYVEKKRDILRFSAQEKIGVTFANTNSIGKTTFTD